MQNEELDRARAELEASRARYFDPYDMAPVGYVTLSEQGVILEANLTAQQEAFLQRARHRSSSSGFGIRMPSPSGRGWKQRWRRLITAQRFAAPW